MVDVYDLCPCGSGKKLKFCCAGIIDEMTKINRLQANDQPRQALASIEKIEKSNPDNPWVGTVHAEILLSLGQVDEAQARLEHLLKQHPGPSVRRGAGSSGALAQPGLSSGPTDDSAGFSEVLHARSRAGRPAGADHLRR